MINSSFIINSSEVIKISAIATVMGMSGHDGASSGMSGHHYERVRIIIRSDILRELRDLGVDVNTVINRLLENFLVAYRVFWVEYDAGGGIRTHAGEAHRFSRPTPYHSATPASG